jgi:hypothetical protein
MRASLVFGFRRYKQPGGRHKSRTLGGCRGQSPVVITESSLAGSGHPDPGTDQQKSTRRPPSRFAMAA